MRNILFFSKVAFICNCSFLLGFVLRYYAFLPQNGMASTIIILGFVAPALNFLLLVVYMLMAIRSKKFNQDDPAGPSGSKEINHAHHDDREYDPSRSIHAPLIGVNFCFLVFQLISLLI